jgi:hypothetical protein
MAQQVNAQFPVDNMRAAQYLEDASRHADVTLPLAWDAPRLDWPIIRKPSNR